MNPFQIKLEQYARDNPNKIVFRGENWELSIGEFSEEVLKVIAKMDQELIPDSTIIGIELTAKSSKWVPILFWGAASSNRVILPINANAPEHIKKTLIKYCHAVWRDDRSSSTPVFWSKKEAVEIDIELGKIAYLTSTSGSSGSPKIVPISSTNLIAFLDSFPGSPENQFYTNVDYYFDVAYPSIFGAIWYQASSTLLSSTDFLLKKSVQDLFTISDTIIQVPTWINIFTKIINSNQELYERLKKSPAKKLIFCGEMLPSSSIKQLKSLFPDWRIYNAYGPCETTVWVSITEVDEDSEDPVSIGQPNAGTLFLVSSDPSSPNSLGELLISGSQVFNGYIDCDRSPFTKKGFWDYYRTGDLAYLGTDNAYHIVGRNDEQIKKDGYRIELQEITSAYLLSEKISECHAIFDKRAIYLFYIGSRMDRNALKEIGGKYLNQYAVPDFFVEINKLPLTANGKVNKKLLLEKVKV